MWQRKGSKGFGKGGGYGKGSYGKGGGKAWGHHKGKGAPDTFSSTAGYGNSKGQQSSYGQQSKGSFGSSSSYGQQSFGSGEKDVSRLKVIDDSTMQLIVPDHAITEGDIALVAAEPTKETILRLLRSKVKEHCNLACSAVHNSKDKFTGEPLLKLRESTFGKSGLYCLSGTTNYCKNIGASDAFDKWRKEYIATRGDNAYTPDGLGYMTFEDFMYLPENMLYYENTGRKQAIEALCYNSYSYLYEPANSYPKEFYITADGKNKVSLQDYLNDTFLPSTLNPAKPNADTGSKGTASSTGPALNTQPDTSKGLGPEQLNALIKSITATAVAALSGTSNASSDQISSAVRNALTPTKKGQPNTGGMNKKAKKGLQMDPGSGSGSGTGSGTDVLAGYFSQITGAANAADTDLENNTVGTEVIDLENNTKAVAAIKLIMATYHKDHPADVPSPEITEENGKRKVEAITTTEDFTLTLYNLMNADRKMNAAAVRGACGEMSLTYPTSPQAKPGATPKQTAMMKISNVCWIWYSTGSIIKTEVESDGSSPSGMYG